jgi:hypothetical protein
VFVSVVVGVGVGVLVNVGVLESVGVFVGVLESVGVFVGVGFGVFAGVEVGVEFGVLVGVGVICGVGLGDAVGLGVDVKKGSMASYISLSVGLDILYLNEGVNTFIPVVGCPSTINLDPLAILPDFGLIFSPIFYLIKPPNNQPYFS